MTVFTRGDVDGLPVDCNLNELLSHTVQLMLIGSGGLIADEKQRCTEMPVRHTLM